LELVTGTQSFLDNLLNYYNLATLVFSQPSCPMTLQFLDPPLLDLNLFLYLAWGYTILGPFSVKLQQNYWTSQTDQGPLERKNNMSICHRLEICTRIFPREHCCQGWKKRVLCYQFFYPFSRDFAIYTTSQQVRQI